MAMLRLMKEVWWALAALVALAWLAIRFYGDQRWGKAVVTDEMVTTRHFDERMGAMSRKLDRGAIKMETMEANIQADRERIIELEVANRILWQPVGTQLERMNTRLDSIESKVAHHDGRMDERRQGDPGASA